MRVMQNTQDNIENKSPNIAQYVKSILIQDSGYFSRAIRTLTLESQLELLQSTGWVSDDIGSQEIAPALAKVAAINLLQSISIDGNEQDTLRVLLALEFFYKALPNGVQPSLNLFARDMLREVFKEPELSERSSGIKKILAQHIDYLIDADRIEVLEGVIDLPHMTHQDSKTFIDTLIFKGELKNITPNMQSMITKLISKLKKPEEIELLEAAHIDGIDGLAVAIVEHRSKTISLIDDTLDQAIFIMEIALKSQHPETKSRILSAVNSAYNRAPFSTFQYDNKMLLATIKFSNALNAYNMPFFNAWDKYELSDQLVFLYNDQTISAEDKEQAKLFYNSYVATYQNTSLAKDMTGFVSATMSNGIDVYAEEKDIERYESKALKILNILDFDSVHQLKQSDPDINLMSIMVKFFVKAADGMVSDPSKAHYIKSFMKSLDAIREHSSKHLDIANEIMPEKTPSLLSKIFSKIVGSSDVGSRER